MARKINPATATPAAPPAKASNPLDDLFVLIPDVELDVGGRKVTLREYKFIDGLRARARAKPLLDDLAALIQGSDASDAGVDAYMEVSAKHEALMRELMADSIEGADADWIDGLSATDGQRVLLTWWEVSGRFFWRAVVQRRIDRMAADHRRKQAARAGQTSSPSSPPADTAAPATSASSTPSVN